MQPYLIPKHVFVCRRNDYLVVLDLRRDRYLALEHATVVRIAAAIEGLEAMLECERGQEPPALPEIAALHPARDDELLTRMLQKGLLTQDCTLGKAASGCSLPTPESAVDTDAVLASEVAVRPRELFGWIHATLTAAILRKSVSVERIVQRVRRRKERFGGRMFSTAAAQRVALVHEYLRPYTLTTPDSCFFDALSLTELLARYRLFPEWVFGVQIEPFAAHCWVQHGTVVLNDSVERVRRFTPILAV